MNDSSLVGFVSRSLSTEDFRCRPGQIYEPLHCADPSNLNLLLSRACVHPSSVLYSDRRMCTIHVLILTRPHHPYHPRITAIVIVPPAVHPVRMVQEIQLLQFQVTSLVGPFPSPMVWQRVPSLRGFVYLWCGVWSAEVSNQKSRAEGPRSVSTLVGKCVETGECGVDLPRPAATEVAIAPTTLGVNIVCEDSSMVQILTCWPMTCYGIISYVFMFPRL